MSSKSHPKKLFLLDAYALIFRAYYAFIKNPRVNSKGLNTSAMFGFTNTLLEVLEKEKPKYIAVVFDSKTATAQRKEIFTEYKANRDETPEDIRLAVPYIKRIIEGFNIPILEAPGYEADDVIGTLAKVAEREGFFTYMMTPDKDFGQLVSDNIVMYKPARSGNGAEILGVKEVCEKFEIERPEQVIDILGLWGDAVDNIPGVPGVGEKTAKKMIAKYGSIEGLYEHTEDLKGKMKEKVEANKEQAFMSKQLATIYLDAPVAFEPEKLVLDDYKEDVLRDVFTELEFRRLSQRVLGETLVSAAPAVGKDGQTDLFGTITEEEPASSADDDSQEEVAYHFTNTDVALDALLRMLSFQEKICFDTETDRLAPVGAQLVGMSFAVSEYEAFYVPFPSNVEEAQEKLQKFAPLFADEEKQFIGHNIKYDILILKNYGIEIAGKVQDTMLMHYFAEQDMRRRSMDALAEVYLKHKTIPIEELIGKKGKGQKSMADLPQEEIVNYACEDADITLRLYHVFEPMLDETARELIRTLEAPLIQVLADMEFEGISVDVEVLKKLSASLAEEAKEVEMTIYEKAGHAFNIASPKQVGEVLFDELKIVDKPKKTKSGQYATGEEVLSKLEEAHPIVAGILEFRELKKLQNTYVEPLPEIVNEKTNRIHTTFNQMVAATGRLSSDKPNLQNIPIRTERGRHIREAFVPSTSDNVLFSADYSQVELRIMAALSEDENMIAAFNEGKDIHAATAARVFDVSLDDVTREQRSKAKMVNFGIIYGISAFGLADRLNISRTEARDIIDAYFEKYPKVKAYMDDSIQKARENGYCETIMGRRRDLRDINSQNHTVRSAAERNAINAPIQGSAADVIKKAMLDVHAFLKSENLQTRMLLQVHDELIFDVPKSELSLIEKKVTELMEGAVSLSVPLKVESGHGTNWLEAH